MLTYRQLHIHWKRPWDFNWNKRISVSENVLENVVCKMAAILFRPPCVQLIYFEFLPTRLFFCNDPGSYVQACEMQSAIVTLADQRKNIKCKIFDSYPDSKNRGANMGPTCVLLAPDGPHVGPMNLAIRVNTSANWVSIVSANGLLYPKPFSIVDRTGGRAVRQK